VADWEGFKHGQVNQIAEGAYAYMQVGGWGFNNMAFVVSDGETLLIDTTSDIPMTKKMLGAFERANPAAAQINNLALTHWHVDHVHGACMPVFRDSRIICTETVEDYMANLPPKAWLGMVESLQGDAKVQMANLLGNHFDFSGLEPVFPTDRFNGRTEFKFGKQRVILTEAKPCHTASDTVVYMPDLGVVHMGDITSANSHQSLQYPGLRNVISILEEAASWDAAVYVAGHGPTMDVADVRDQLDYCRWLWGEAQRRFEKGMGQEEAADDLMHSLGDKRTRRGPIGLYLTMKMVFAELADRPNDHARKNYPRYLEDALRHAREFPHKHPELAAPA
jgi:glyoxylase-like metal-dependent hydrolase (beta-lactamase superfamily II)